MRKRSNIYGIWIIPLFLVVMLGCSTVPSKRGTALDHIKKDLKSAAATNKNLVPITKLPIAVENSLKPTLATVVDNTADQMRPEVRFNVVADAVPAQAFFLGLIEDTDVNLTLHPKVDGNISIKLKNVNVMDVLTAIQRMYGYGIEIDNNNIRVLPAELQTRTFKINYLDITREGSSETKISSSGLESSSSNNGNSISNNNNGLNYGNNGGDLGNVSNNNNNSSGSATNSKINTKSNSNFWEKLEITLKTIIGTEGGRKVAVIPMTGMVIVQAMPDELIKVEQFLKQSQLFLNRQVILEAKILEVELNDAYRAGINWSQISSHLNVSQLGNGVDSNSIDVGNPLPTDAGTMGSMSQTTSSTTGDVTTSTTTNMPVNSNIVPVSAGNRSAPAVANTTSPFGGILTLGFNYHRLATFVELLSSQGNVQVLSSPRISTTNNQKALIKVGSDSFFVTNITSSTTTNSVNNTVNTPTVQFDSFFSGIALDVTPQIEEDGHVTLHVHPTISMVTTDTQNLIIGGQAQSYPLASSTIRESDSIIRARNGQFVVLGGLMQDKTGEVISGIPILKDLPFIGAVFRQTSQLAKKTELVILLRPLVIDDNDSNTEIEDSLERFEKLDRGFHVGGNVGWYGNEGENGR